ncbi:hypothetical protein WG66_007984 [Moniliophthora roreri]|uniref:Uncharacterized protein n=1 Tax=Moniliophthora roreri TaxID=221103 RepID=A0A0W0FX19_MONRR|nr:hypothetical protein WG66_007984 [Moniliophthora roreri]
MTPNGDTAVEFRLYTRLLKERRLSSFLHASYLVLRRSSSLPVLSPCLAFLHAIDSLHRELPFVSPNRFWQIHLHLSHQRRAGGVSEANELKNTSSTSTYQRYIISGSYSLALPSSSLPTALGQALSWDQLLLVYVAA